jgi:hypothetical protein
MAVGGGTNTTPSRNRGGRAFKPGPRWAFGGAAVLALVVAGALVLVLSGGSSNPNTRYGPLPTWLPKSVATAHAPTMEVATPAKPILSEEQGYTVHAELPTGSAEVTANGPLFPAYVTKYAQSGSWPNGKLVPSTFYVTFANVKGTIPIAVKDFDVLNGNGERSLAKSVTVKGGGKLPSALHKGQTVTLLVKANALEGQGTVRWAPQAPKILVAWLWQLELD